LGCGCGGGAKKRAFEHIGTDGKVTEVATQAEAALKVRQEGGTWRLKKR
jgi:hypothetical protein